MPKIGLTLVISPDSSRLRRRRLVADASAEPDQSLPGPLCDQRTKEEFMPKYVIERDIPGAGKLSRQELKAISQKSCGVLNNMGPQIQWVESFVTGDKVYCIYVAPNEKMV